MYYTYENIPMSMDMDEVLKATDWAIQKLSLPDDCTVHIEFKKVGSACGYIDDEEDGEYHVVINEKLSFREAIFTIFHELVHVKQMCTGRLKHSPSGVSVWRRKPVQNVPYDQRPWEIEAESVAEMMMQDQGLLLKKSSVH